MPGMPRRFLPWATLTAAVLCLALIAGGIAWWGRSSAPGARLDVPAGLYQDPGGGGVTRKTGGYHEPKGTAAAGACAILVSATRDDRRGIYLDDLQGHPRRIAGGDFQHLATAADGHAVAAVQDQGGHDGDALVILDLPATGC